MVEWMDSYGCSANWQEIDPDLKPMGMVCKSVGWIVKRDKNYLVLVPHLSEEKEGIRQQGCGDMTIPTASVVRVTPLRY